MIFRLVILHVLLLLELRLYYILLWMLVLKLILRCIYGILLLFINLRWTDLIIILIMN